MRIPVLLVVITAMLGCGDHFPPPKSDPPTAPDSNDPAFAIAGLHNWYLIGDGVTPDDNQLTVIVTAPKGSKFVDAYIGTLPVVRADEQSEWLWPPGRSDDARCG